MKHTPTLWAEYDNTTYKTLKAVDYEHARACVNAFHGSGLEAGDIPEGLVRRMREALEHYADPKNWNEDHACVRGGVFDRAIGALTYDKGETARTLLSEISPKEKGS